MSELRLYVPAADALTDLLPGSAIVGHPTEQGRALVDFEGNKYGATNIRTYADRAYHAAGRHVWKGIGYPTIARRLVPERELVEIGSYDTSTWTAHIDDRAALAAWLDVTDAELADELLRSDR